VLSFPISYGIIVKEQAKYRPSIKAIHIHVIGETRAWQSIEISVHEASVVALLCSADLPMQPVIDFHMLGLAAKLKI